MWLIIALIILGVFLLIAEIILLPGLTIAGIGAVVSYGAAVYLAFTGYGTTAGIIAIASCVAISFLTTALSLRARTWQRLSLTQSVDSTSQPLPADEIEVGAKGIALTRLAPIGKVEIDGNTYEARAADNTYVNPGASVEVTGFENFTVIVNIVEDTNK